MNGVQPPTVVLSVRRSEATSIVTSSALTDSGTHSEVWGRCWASQTALLALVPQCRRRTPAVVPAPHGTEVQLCACAAGQPGSAPHVHRGAEV